jgi:ADP-heptose:LPS heptosyltransferase
MVQRILVIQTAFIGDVILATPVPLELKRLFPSAKIDMLVKKGNGILLRNNPAITDILEFDKQVGKGKELLRLLRQIRSINYDLVINLHRFGSSGILTIFSGAKRTIGFTKNPFSLFFSERYPHEIGNEKHEVERNLSLVRKFGAVSKRRPEIFPSKQDVEKTDKYKETSYYCMAPASVWFTKQLPETKWVELIRRQAQQGKIYLLGAPDDRILCERIIAASKVENIENLAGKLTLMESAALIKHALRTYVNDSGPLHIASAMNAPVTAFFCSTSPDFGFGPLSEDALVIESLEKLPCKPCGLHGFTSCPQGNFRCGNEIAIS